MKHGSVGRILIAKREVALIDTTNHSILNRGSLAGFHAIDA
jgi:hypothetical protein